MPLTELSRMAKDRKKGCIKRLSQKLAQTKALVQVMTSTDSGGLATLVERILFKRPRVQLHRCFGKLSSKVKVGLL